MSADGRLVAFISFATNLGTRFPDARQAFIRDRETGRTELVSVQRDGTASAAALDAKLNADGRYVAFTVEGSDDVVTDGTLGSRQDVVVRDRVTGAVDRVSVALSGERPDGQSGSFGLSADGRFVVFQSSASNLVSDDNNGQDDIFLRDRLSHTTERVNLSNAGEEANSFSGTPAISADGRFVSFSSCATNLVAGADNCGLFLRDLALHRTERVDLSSVGVGGDGASVRPALSADGHFVAFTSTAGNLVPNDTNGEWDVFVRDRHDGTTERVSITNTGAERENSDDAPIVSISADGRFVSFTFDALDFSRTDANGQGTDVYVRDRALATTVQVNVNSLGEGATSTSTDAYLSADGRFVIFTTDSPNLVPNDTNGTHDVFASAVPVPAAVSKVAIDIRPNMTANPIHPKGNGSVPVAILSHAGFDPTRQVNLTTLTFGHSGSEQSLVRCKTRGHKDANKDGTPDLICRFEIRKARFQPNDRIGILRFRDLTGKEFAGRDAIKIRDRDEAEDFATVEDD